MTMLGNEVRTRYVTSVTDIERLSNSTAAVREQGATLPVIVGISHVAPSLHASTGYSGFENPAATYIRESSGYAGFENPAANGAVAWGSNRRPERSSAPPVQPSPGRRGIGAHLGSDHGERRALHAVQVDPPGASRPSGMEVRGAGDSSAPFPFRAGLELPVLRPVNAEPPRRLPDRPARLHAILPKHRGEHRHSESLSLSSIDEANRILGCWRSAPRSPHDRRRSRWRQEGREVGSRILPAPSSLCRSSPTAPRADSPIHTTPDPTATSTGLPPIGMDWSTSRVSRLTNTTSPSESTTQRRSSVAASARNVPPMSRRSVSRPVRSSTRMRSPNSLRSTLRRRQ